MSEIVGTWELKSLTFTEKEKIVSYPFGRNVNGLVIYHGNGYMSGVISGEGRPEVSSTATRGISDAERLAISRNFIAYAGKYRIEDDMVCHMVMSSFLPNLMNEESHNSKFEVNGNILITTSIPQNDLNKNIVLQVIWEKIE